MSIILFQNSVTLLIYIHGDEHMKKNYDTRLLIVAILLILTQITSFTLQDYFGASKITGSITVDIIISFVIAFFLLAQFKGVHRVTSIVALIYAAMNLVTSFSTRTRVRSYFVDGDPNLSVFVMLAFLLGYALLTIAAIFLLIHTTQKRFEDDFTSKLVGVSLLASLFLLIAGAFILPVKDYTNIVTRIATLGSLGALYLTMFFLVKSDTIERRLLGDTKDTNKRKEKLEQLYHDGLISEDEYKRKKND